MRVIKKIIPLKLKVIIRRKYEDYKLDKKYKEIKTEKKFFIIGTPHHGNLGDQAIIHAEIGLLKDYFQEYNIYEISLIEYYNHFKYFKKHIKNNDVIFINGGGNFGNQYLFDENIRRHVIENFPQNKIILFPQTMHFTNDDKGKTELEKSQKIYNSHKKLLLIAREKKSYNDMKKNFTSKILLAPDIVLYLQKTNNSVKRQGALYCMRSDVESNLSNNEKDFILEKLQKNYKDILITDTVIKNLVLKEDRDSFLENKFNEFRGSEIVVTDRIHGMIFAAITGTPCIALSNYNHKVIGTYEWIKKLEYIRFINDVNEIENNIIELKSISKVLYSNKIFAEYYNNIISEIG